MRAIYTLSMEWCNVSTGREIKGNALVLDCSSKINSCLRTAWLLERLCIGLGFSFLIHNIETKGEKKSTAVIQIFRNRKQRKKYSICIVSFSFYCNPYKSSNSFKSAWALSWLQRYLKGNVNYKDDYTNYKL